MTNLGACCIRRGAVTSLQVLPSRVIARSVATRQSWEGSNEFAGGLSHVPAASCEIATPCSARLAMTNLGAFLIRRDAVTSLQVLPSRVIARRAQARRGNLGKAFPISTGHCSNGMHPRLVIPRSEATWESQAGSHDFAGRFPVTQPASVRSHPKARPPSCVLLYEILTESGKIPAFRILTCSKFPFPEVYHGTDPRSSAAAA